MAYTNSPLVDYTRISPNRSVGRNHSIDTITIHCVVGQCSVETLGAIFAPSSRQASSNYGIGYDGKIGMYCEEKDRSWCTSSGANDNRAITIEVASDTYDPYRVNAKAYAALIDLCTDICKRNDIKQLKWEADKSMIGQPEKQNMTVHRWFANKSCPGKYLYDLHSQIAKEVNARLGTNVEVAVPDEDEPVTVLLFKAGDIVKITGTKYYGGKAVPAWVRNKNWVVYSAAGDRVVVNKSEDGKNAIMSPFNVADLALVSTPSATTPVSGTPSTGSAVDEKKIWDYFMDKLGSAYGVAGLMGNLNAESALRSNNLQNTYEKSLGMADAVYTAAVDNGTYTNFVKDSAGYGLAQWTYWSRKQKLYDFAKAAKKSIGDFDMQLDFLWKELSESYKTVVNDLKTATSVLDASNSVLLNFERPANQGESVQKKRAEFGQKYYDKYAPKTEPESPVEPEKPAEPVTPATSIKKGDVVSIAKGATYYNGKAVPAWVIAKTWIVASDPVGTRVVINKSADGKNAIMSPIDAKYLTVVNAEKVEESWTPKVGDIVVYNGTKHYTSANATKAATCKGGQAKITNIYQLGKSKHPYHLVRVMGKGASVYGWVDEGTFTKA